METYDHKQIEEKWRERWTQDKVYRTTEDTEKEKFYILDMFPYPSGTGLHVGHPKGFIATDIISRYKRMKGFNVLHPMGWDAFGLPAEQYAIKNKLNPRTATAENIANYKKQLEMMSLNYDWEREISTTDPGFYKWTQWAFIQMFKQGLVFQSNEAINWCPSCKTGLANEDLEDGRCERCESEIEKKKIPQWVIRITDYADRMLADLEKLDWQPHIKEMQRNWIGKSQGARISFELKDHEAKIEVFTTRPDTLFGATYMVLAPEHDLVNKVLGSSIENWDEVMTYVSQASKKTTIERTDGTRKKTGVKLEGIWAINPASGEEIPVYVADYVLADYGTGAIMAVPAHDERDFAFAREFDLPIKQVMVSCEIDRNNPPQDQFKMVERPTVIVHLRDRSTGKYALLDWKGGLEGITAAITGGIEENQTPEEAALAEIREEAGLTEVRIIKQALWITSAEYCAVHKSENRRALAHAFVAEVENLDSQEEIAVHEAEQHTLVWVAESEVRHRLTPAHQKKVWDLLHEEEQALVGTGLAINSGQFDGLPTEEAKEKMTEFVGGEMTTTYRLNDWVFSRQRYWGEPIPLVYAPDGTVYPLAESELPLTLPEVENYEPTGTAQSPLAHIDHWVKVRGIINNQGEFVSDEEGEVFQRETNTMPQWAGSSWYYLRYIDPDNREKLISREKEKYWSPVDFYVGGAEHATRHLIYARFWHKFLYDMGVVSYDEPFQKLQTVGLIMAEDGRKMSKRWGNVINPNDVIEEFGADSLRVYEMFMSPFENTVAWSTNGLVGARRFLEKIIRLKEKITAHSSPEIMRETHKVIKKVGEDINAMKYNTAVATMMALVGQMEGSETVGEKEYINLLTVLSPFAPHLTQELYSQLGHEEYLILADWPAYDEALIIDEVIELAVQVNGKMRGRIALAPDAEQETALQQAQALNSVHKWLEEKEIKQVIYVPGRIMNIVV